MEQLQSDALKAIGSVSTLLRNAIAAAMPVAPEQYLTVAIPGTAIDLADYDNGGSFVYDMSRYATPPTAVRQAEARLVDNMIPISNIMIGNTGKSVARAYSRSLDALLPAKATITSGQGIRSPGNPSYNEAMKYLKAPIGAGKTIVDVYREKQKAWGEARSDWDKAKSDAQREAERLFPPTSGADYIGKQKQFINNWNQEHYAEYKANTQAAWMDWVVNASKYDVDFNFGLIDIDSIMGRIESSKESLRNSTIPDADGANEVYGVSLSPSRWATYCKRKAEGWYEKNGTFTLSQLEAEINRLTSLALSYQTTQDLVMVEKNEYPASGVDPPKADLAKLKTELDAKTKALYSAQGKLAGAKHNASPVLSDPKATKEQKDAAQKTVDDANKAVQDAEKALQDAQDAYNSAQREKGEYDRLVLAGKSKDEVQQWIKSKLATIKQEIEFLTKLRDAKLAQEPTTVPVITGASAPKDDKDLETTHGTLIAAEGSEKAAPMFKPLAAGTPAPGGGTSPSDPSAPPRSAEDADPWTTITFSYSSTDLKNVSESSSWGMKVGSSVGYGLWSAGGSYAHDEAHSKMQSDMAACDVSISFSALVVNVERPWLYGELFNDVDLELADGVSLSPGPLKLHKMIQEQNPEEIGKFSQFPAYPTSFIIAADTTIEFHGSTKHLEEQYDAQSNSGGFSFGYGPWSVSSSFHQEDQKQSMQLKTTSTGCKLSFGAPQVIGWVSEILPALPRDKSFNPLSQGAGLPLPRA